MWQYLFLFLARSRPSSLAHSTSLGNLRLSASQHQLTFREQLVPTFRVPAMTVADAAQSPAAVTAAVLAAAHAHQRVGGANRTVMSRSYKSMNDLQSQQLRPCREITSIN